MPHHTVFHELMQKRAAGGNAGENGQRASTDGVQEDTLLRDKVRLVYVMGDTVRITDSVTIERVRVQIRADTIKRIDSIPYPVEVRVTEYRRSGYDRFCSVAFWTMAGLVAMILGIKIYRLRF